MKRFLTILKNLFPVRQLSVHGNVSVVHRGGDRRASYCSPFPFPNDAFEQIKRSRDYRHHYYINGIHEQPLLEWNVRGGFKFLFYSLVYARRQLAILECSTGLWQLSSQPAPRQLRLSSLSREFKSTFSKRHPPIPTDWRVVAKRP